MSHSFSSFQNSQVPAVSGRSDPHARFPVASPRRLGSYLVEAGLITNAQIEVVLNDQSMMEEMRFGEVLVARGWIKAETIDFIMRRVVEPERAQTTAPPISSPGVADSSSNGAAQTAPQLPSPQSAPHPADLRPADLRPAIAPPPLPTAQPQIVARARSLDGDFEFDIVQDFSLSSSFDDSDIAPTVPLTAQEMQQMVWNDRKSLPSTPKEGEVNWAG